MHTGNLIYFILIYFHKITTTHTRLHHFTSYYIVCNQIIICYIVQNCVRVYSLLYHKSPNSECSLAFDIMLVLVLYYVHHMFLRCGESCPVCVCLFMYIPCICSCGNIEGCTDSDTQSNTQGNICE